MRWLLIVSQTGFIDAPGGNWILGNGHNDAL